MVAESPACQRLRPVNPRKKSTEYAMQPYSWFMSQYNLLKDLTCFKALTEAAPDMPWPPFGVRLPGWTGGHPDSKFEPE